MEQNPQDMAHDESNSAPACTTLTQLATKYKELKKLKEDTDDRLKEVKEEFKAAESALVDAMLGDDFQNFNHAGTLYSLRNNLRASPFADNKDALYAALREHDCGALIQETINAQTLSSFVREQRGENDGETPEWLDGLVDVYEWISISARQAAK